MSSILRNFNIMSDGPKVVLLIAAISLWVICYTLNKKALENLESSQMDDMKNQVEQLRKVTWALYAVYLLYYFFNTYQPVSGMLSGNTNVGIIGTVLTTILVLCITHVSNVCTDSNCDMPTAKSSLERINILLSILVVVHIGTIVVFMLSPSSKIGFTAEILELLRTPSNRRSFQRRSPILHSGIDYY
jgi:uncharacterized protein involved in cysteine biosynthesis